MSSVFLRHGGSGTTAQVARAPIERDPATTGRTNVGGHTRPGGCNYRGCTTPAPHRFPKCADFARAVASGKDTPRYDHYRYTGTTPVPGLAAKWTSATPSRPSGRAAHTADPTPADELPFGELSVGDE